MIDNHYQITEIVEAPLVEVWAFPDAIEIILHGHSATLSFEQAENLGMLLEQAIEQGKSLEWDDSDPHNPDLVEKQSD